MTNRDTDPLTLINLDPDWLEAEAFPECLADQGWFQGLVALVFS